MTIPQTSSPAEIAIVPARPEQEPILANLLELYIHDFSEFMELKLGADGRFGYPHLASYWTESDRHPFLVTVDGHLAGFALVRIGSGISDDQDVWDMAEFFIVRGFRRLGIGMKVAHEIWRRFPGTWEVRVMARNQRAKPFWKRAVSEYLGRACDPILYDEGGKCWYVFSFESKPAASQ